MAGVCCLKLSKLQACGSCFTLVRKPLAMPVVPAVAPPPSSFRDGGSRPATGARRGGCAAREGRELWTRTAYRTRAGIARATRRGHRGVAGGCRAARPKGRSAGRPGCRAAPGWWRGAPDPTTRASASGSRPGAARATWWAGRGGRGATTPREWHQGRGPCERGPDDVGEGLPRGHRRPRRAGRREARPAAV